MPPNEKKPPVELRDYFAAHALVVARQIWDERASSKTRDSIADIAYEIADAMLAARERPS